MQRSSLNLPSLLLILLCCSLMTAATMGQGLIHPTLVAGKEYSENADQDDFANNDFLQNLRWSGFGTTFDAFDYSNSGSPPEDPDNVDALANGQDYLFNEVKTNQVPFLVSFSSLSDVHFHMNNGTTGIWATRPQVRLTPRLSDDLDALEIWGDANTPQDGTALIFGDDANYFSIKGDFILPNGIPPAISVYKYDPATDSSSLAFTHDEIRDSVANLLSIPNDFQIDVDAMMINGEDIMFSLIPNSTVGLDGGELFTWRRGNVSAQYLIHGGRVWNTQNPVGTIFGVNTENIDAFEGITAVPEPSGIGLLMLALLFACRHRKRRIRQLI